LPLMQRREPDRAEREPDGSWANRRTVASRAVPSPAPAAPLIRLDTRHASTARFGSQPFERLRAD